MIPQECVDLFLHLLCLADAAPCNPDTGLLLPVCEENCRLYQLIRAQQICQSLDQFVASLRNDAGSELYNNLDCTDLSSFFGNITTDSNDCTKLFSPDSEGIPIQLFVQVVLLQIYFLCI